MGIESREKHCAGAKFCGALVFSKVASGMLFQRKNDVPLVPSEKQNILLSKIAILHWVFLVASGDFQVGPVDNIGLLSLSQMRAMLPLDKGMRIWFPSVFGVPAKA